jgi:ribose transport system substrate-binding protein
VIRFRRTSLPLLLTLVVGAVIAVSASASSSRSNGATARSAEDPVRIAFFLGSLANNYQRAQLTGLKAGAAKHGGAVAKVYDSKDFTASTQRAQIQDAITSKQFDAFVITPNDGGAIAGVIQDALDAGIKVVCISANCGPDPIATKNQIPGMTTTIALPFFKNGQMIAGLIVKACGNKNPCNVVYMPASTRFRSRLRATAASTVS